LPLICHVINHIISYFRFFIKKLIRLNSKGKWWLNLNGTVTERQSATPSTNSLFLFKRLLNLLANIDRFVRVNLLSNQRYIFEFGDNEREINIDSREGKLKTERKYKLSREMDCVNKNWFGVKLDLKFRN